MQRGRSANCGQWGPVANQCPVNAINRGAERDERPIDADSAGADCNGRTSDRYTSSQLHRVVSGDTLWEIASTYDVDVEALVAANSGLIADPNCLQIGWELVIPGALGNPTVDTPPEGTELQTHIVQAGTGGKLGKQR